MMESVLDSIARYNKTCPNFEAKFITADCHLVCVESFDLMLAFTV